MDKKAALDYMDSWPELWAALALAIGLVIGIALDNDFLIVLVTCLTGLASSRLLSKNRYGTKIGFIIIILGFVIGFIIGVKFFGTFSNWKLLLFLFVTTSFIGYYLYEKKIIPG